MRQPLFALALLLLTACSAGPVPAVVREATPVGGAVARQEAEAVQSEVQEETVGGLLTVAYAAGAKVFEFTLRVPASWRGRYALEMADPSTATLLYIGDPDATPVELLALIAMPEATWNATPATPRSEIAIQTLDGVVFAYRLPSAAAPTDEAARMMAEAASVLGSLELSVAE